MQFVIHLQRILTYSLAAIPLIPQQWVTYLISSWGIFSLFLLDLKKFDAKQFFWMLLLASPFFLLLIQAWVSQNSTDWFAVEKANSFWVFPLCFIFLKKEIPPINHLIFHRVMAYCMAALAVLTSMYFLLFGFNITALKQHDFIFRYRNEINQLIHIHPTYLSLMAVYSLLFLFHSAPKFNNSINRFHLIIALVLFAFTYFLAARLVWIAGTVSLMMLILLNKHISAGWKIGILIALTVLVAGMFAANPRTAEFFSFKEDHTATNSLKVRSVIFSCSISLIPESLPLGLGPAETQKKLNACFGNEPVFRSHSFNTHNQYLDYLLSLGIPGFLFLVLILLAGFMVAWKDYNQLFLSFLILSFITMLGENILNRQSGVVFFCLMFSLYIRQHIVKADEK
jgi:O-antigen ligase